VPAQPNPPVQPGGADGGAAPGLWLGAFHAGLRGEGRPDDDNPRMNGARP
jgi:hypothetical protein